MGGSLEKPRETHGVRCWETNVCLHGIAFYLLDCCGQNSTLSRAKAGKLDSADAEGTEIGGLEGDLHIRNVNVKVPYTTVQSCAMMRCGARCHADKVTDYST
jgi:hypothetical protein